MFKNKSMKKMHRVSRLINDIRSSSKHTDSLVVQTGFPTSLIDLFVKHGSRFNKSSSSVIKKHSKNPSPPHPSPLVEEIRSTNLHPHPHPHSLTVVDSVSDSIDSDGIEVWGEKSRVVFMNVVKMFVILSFAFVTKRLAISVTFWACLLLFLEHWFKSHRNKVGEEEIICFCSQGSDSLIGKTETDDEELLQFGEENQIQECKLPDSHEKDKEEIDMESVNQCRGLPNPNRMCRAKLRAKQFRKLVTNKFRANGGIEAK